MARPIKRKVDYFSHDADASEGRTLSILFNNFGHEGVSCWWQLLERVSGTNNHVINLRNGEDTEFLAAKLHFKKDRLLEILDKMADLEAIDPKLWQVKTIWIQNLVDRLGEVYSKRRQPLPSKPGLSPTKTGLTTTETELSPTETPQSKLNKTKLNNNVLFETFWDAYPRKEAKVKAEKAFKKINPDEKLLATMLDMLERFKKTKQWQDRQLIPHPATWLNAKRWEDELDKPEKIRNSWS